jgi:hypothetical protein
MLPPVNFGARVLSKYLQGFVHIIIYQTEEQQKGDNDGNLEFIRRSYGSGSGCGRARCLPSLLKAERSKSVGIIGTWSMSDILLIFRT